MQSRMEPHIPGSLSLSAASFASLIRSDSYPTIRIVPLALAVESLTREAASETQKPFAGQAAGCNRENVPGEQGPNHNQPRKGLPGNILFCVATRS